MTSLPYPAESPAGKILAHLQRHGEATVKDLEELLQISTTAVREHLTHLQAKDMLATRLVRRGPGRADVEDLEVTEEEPEGLSGFDVR